MIFKYTAYSPTKNTLSPLDVKRKMPTHLSEELLTENPFSYGIFIDSNKVNAISMLDKYFRVGKKLAFTKHEIVEIDHNELDLFDYYRIVPKVLDPCDDIHVEYDMSDTTDIVKSIRLSKSLPGKHCIYELWTAKARTILIISSLLKDHFDRSGIHGLRYSKIIPANLHTNSNISKLDYYAAIITEESQCEADNIIPDNTGHNYKKRIVSAPHLFGLKYPSTRLKNSDFQYIRDIHVGNKVYHRAKPELIVSQRTIRLLLELKAEGLSIVANVMGIKYAPLKAT